MYLLGYSLDNLSLMALTLVGRLRGRRRDRHAREHRAPHRDGEAAAAGGARRLARDRLHDRLDDDLAGRGVHPGAVHGRPARPAVPRVRGHDQRRDPGLGLRLADADADAVQPLPEAGTATERHGRVLPGDRARLRRARSAFYERSSPGSWHRRRWRSCSRALILVGTVVLVRIVPKGFIPSEDPDQLTGTHRDGRGHLVRGDGRSTSRRSRRSWREDPERRGFMSSVGGGGAARRGNQGPLIIRLKPRYERKLHADEVIHELQPKLAAVPGIRVVPPEPAVDQHRRPRVEEPVPVHAPELGHRRALRRRRPRWRRELRELPGPRRT